MVSIYWKQKELRRESSLNFLLTELQKTISDNSNLNKTDCYCKTLSLKVWSRCIKRIDRKEKLLRNIPTTGHWKNWIFSVFDLVVRRSRQIVLKISFLLFENKVHRRYYANLPDLVFNFCARMRKYIYLVRGDVDQVYFPSNIAG